MKDTDLRIRMYAEGRCFYCLFCRNIWIIQDFKKIIREKHKKSTGNTRGNMLQLCYKMLK